MRFPQSAAFRPVPSGPPPILSRMGEPAGDTTEEFASFARGSLAPLVAVILPVVRDEALERRRQTDLSGLVDAQALPNRERDRHES
jgi:hypothetical protein